MGLKFPAILTLAFGLCFSVQAAEIQGAAEIRVAAAASLTDALNAASALFSDQTGHKVLLSYAGSSTLAKQVERGMPVDVFIPADLQWMDYLDQRGMLHGGSRTILAHNELVLVGSGEGIDVAKADFAKMLGDQRLVTGDPTHVPVGRYAKAALIALGQWQAVEPRLATVDSVRAAIALVERGEAPFGIVYATDIGAARDVKVLGSFPEWSHPRVEYPIALVKDAQEAGRQFIAFLLSAQGQAVLGQFGFKAP